MARYSAEQKSQSREAILASAAKLFRLRGYDGVGIPEIAQKAGLTHGTFYAHFDSKESLLGAVVSDAKVRRTRPLGGVPDLGGIERAKSLVARYLSEEHLIAFDRGCIIPGLGADLSRHRPRAGKLTQDYIESFIHEFLVCGLQEPRARLISSSMVGGLVLARLLDGKTRVDFLKDVQKETLLLLVERGKKGGEV